MGLLRRSLELGLGALLLTKEAAEDLLGPPVEGESPEDRERRRRTVDEIVARGQRFREELEESLREEVDAALARAGLVRREEFDRLAERVLELERRLAGGEFEAASDL